MAAGAMRPVLERLAAHAEQDESFADALAFLARTHLAADDDPFASPAREVLTVARRMNATRLDERRQHLIDEALTTAQVVALAPTMSDRKAVDRRRTRGRLLGLRLGSTTYHPAWQFDRRTGETRPGLVDVLSALDEVAADPMAAHQLMTAPQAELDGRTPAEVFGDGDVQRALTAIRLAGDQS